MAIIEARLGAMVVSGSSDMPFSLGTRPIVICMSSSCDITIVSPIQRTPRFVKFRASR